MYMCIPVSVHHMHALGIGSPRAEAGRMMGSVCLGGGVVLGGYRVQCVLGVVEEPTCRSLSC